MGYELGPGRGTSFEFVAGCGVLVGRLRSGDNL